MLRAWLRNHATPSSAAPLLDLAAAARRVLAARPCLSCGSHSKHTSCSMPPRRAARQPVAAAAAATVPVPKVGSAQEKGRPRRRQHSTATTDTTGSERAAAAPQPGASPSTPSSTAKKKGPRQAEPSAAVLAAMEELRPKAGRIAAQLAQLYPDPPIPLTHSSSFQLLCAVLLSAQTTDKAVNVATPALFALAPDAASMAALVVPQIEACIRQLGLAPTKARNLKAMSQLLVERHGGEVPESLLQLEQLPGVGHKTASVVMAQAFGHDAFPVDTHIHRLAQRWGLSCGRSVEQTEADLKALFPQPLWRHLHLQIIYFGREACPAKTHDPRACPICSWAAVLPYDQPGASPIKPGQRPAAAAAAGSGGGKKAARKRPEPAAAAADPAGGEVGKRRRGGAADRMGRS